MAFDYRAAGDAVDFIVYDPNDPTAPGIVRFDPRDERFHAPALRRVRPYFRAFRQLLLPLLLSGYVSADGLGVREGVSC